MALGPLIGRGRTAEIYRYGRERVLKLFIKNFPEFLVDHEFKANKIAQQSISNVPVVYEKLVHKGRIGLLYEFVPGPNLSEVIFSNPSKTLGLTTEFAQLHANIHEIRAPGLRSQIDYIRDGIERVEMLDSQKKATILDYLDKLPEGETLCHFDYHFENIICSPRGMVVIDWMNAVRGSAYADAARTKYILSHSAPTGKPSFIRRCFIRFFRHIVTRRYVNEYCHLANCSPEEIGRWELPILASRLSENIPEEHADILNRIENLLA